MKSALVVGGSRGIGRATALALGRAGLNVAVMARGRQPVEKVVRLLHDAGSTPMGLTVDAADEERVGQAVERVRSTLGEIDVLVHAVGVYPCIPLDQCERSAWDDVLRTNLTSAFLCSKAVVPVMLEQGGGMIVLLGSAPVTRSRARPDREAYYASKGGLIGLAAGLRASYEDRGVRTLVVHPGWTVDTDDASRPEEHLTADQVAAAIRSLVTAHPDVHVRELTVTARRG